MKNDISMLQISLYSKILNFLIVLLIPNVTYDCSGDFQSPNIYIYLLTIYWLNIPIRALYNWWWFLADKSNYNLWIRKRWERRAYTSIQNQNKTLTLLQIINETIDKKTCNSWIKAILIILVKECDTTSKHKCIVFKYHCILL